MPSGSRSDRDLPLWELLQTSWVVLRGFHAVFAEVGLSPGQFGTLVALDELGDLTQAELARHLKMRPQSIGELVGSLVERGLITRHGPPGRGRRSALILTDGGRRTLEHAWPGVYAFNAPEAIGLTPRESTNLSRLLRSLRQTLIEHNQFTADTSPTINQQV